MSSLVALVALVSPLALGLAAVLCFAGAGLRPRRTMVAAEVLALGAVLGAAASVLVVALAGTTPGPRLGTDWLGLSVRLDAVSATMLALVSFVGWVVVRFSATYLDGEARQGAFLGWLCATLKLEQVRERLQRAVTNGASRQDLEALVLELADLSDRSAYDLRNLLRTIEAEQDAAQAIASEVATIKAAQDRRDLSQALTLEWLCPPSLAAARQSACRSRCTVQRLRAASYGGASSSLRQDC